MRSADAEFGPVMRTGLRRAPGALELAAVFDGNDFAELLESLHQRRLDTEYMQGPGRPVEATINQRPVAGTTQRLGAFQLRRDQFQLATGVIQPNPDRPQRDAYQKQWHEHRSQTQTGHASLPGKTEHAGKIGNQQAGRQ